MARASIGMVAGGAASVFKSNPTAAYPDTDDPLVRSGVGGTIHSPHLTDRNAIGAARVSAVATNTIGGTPAEDDILSLTFGVRGGVTVTITLGDTYTAAEVAALQAAAINATPALNDIIKAHAVLAVVHLIHNGGIGGNYVTLTADEDGDATQTLNIATMAGGEGPIRAVDNFSAGSNGVIGAVASIKSYRQGHFYVVSAHTAEALVLGGAPVA